MNLKQAGTLGFLFMCLHLCSAVNITTDATLGIFLQQEILASYFISDPSDPVRFIASASGSPDLPPWLRFEQKDPTDRAFIYGTPGREVSSRIVLEITGWNKKDYTTKRQEMIINIDKSKDIPHYQAEFLVQNSSIVEFLERDEFISSQEDVYRISWTATEERICFNDGRNYTWF